MKCAVDLHIHSCLSPCGDMDMTPNNIVNMAKLKGLDMIAVSDHNTARQLPAVSEVAKSVGIALLPAVELTTREEVHMLAYFTTVDAALAFSNYVYEFLPSVKNRPTLFGRQAVMDSDDEIVSDEPKLLISALDLSVNELAERAVSFGGLCVPAHINRGSNGILQALGFIPPDIDFSALEVSESLPLDETGLPRLPRLRSSDAHILENILERESFLDLDEITPEAFFKALKTAHDNY